MNEVKPNEWTGKFSEDCYPCGQCGQPESRCKCTSNSNEEMNDGK